MKKLNQIHAYDDGEIYAEVDGTKFYLAVRFLDYANYSNVNVFKWVGEGEPTPSDSLIKSCIDWEIFTTFELTCTGEGEIDWEAYEIDLEEAVEI